tara:strand:+ start:231 stop:1355 length:1125 start_codon:yes stop_codon:yes gene_type:complete
MAVFMNAKGTQSSVFQIGKRGNKIFGATATPTASECNTGDLWFDISNNETKIATKSGDSVTWNKIITENFGDVTITGNLTVQGTQTTVNSTSVEIQNAFVFEGASADAHETTLTTVEPTADNTIKLPNASGNLVLSGAIDVDDLVGTAYVATGEVWNDNDSELATTGRISDFIGTEIANSTVIMHTTGAETMAGVKTFTNGATISSGGTLTVTGATVTGLSSDSVGEGSSNLYFTNPRARAAISVTDGSSAGDELSYNSSTGVISWAGTSASTTNVDKVTALSFGSLTDYDVITTSATLTSDFGTVANTGNTSNDHGFIFRDSGLPQLPSYTVATLPDTVAGDLALCTDETGGSTVVFYDGSNWRRMADRAVAS